MLASLPLVVMSSGFAGMLTASPKSHDSEWMASIISISKQRPCDATNTPLCLASSFLELSRVIRDKDLGCRYLPLVGSEESDVVATTA